MISALLLLALGLLPGPARAGGASQAGRLHRARLDLAGPLETVELEAGRGVTRLVLDLRAGESVRIVVPVSERSPLDLVEPRVRRVVPGAGRAAFAGWVTAPQEWEELPAGLRARVRPPVGPRAAVVGWRTLALLGGVALLVAGARRRPVAALALGLAGAALVFLFPGTEGPGAPAPIRVLEGEAETGRWLAVEAAYAQLAVEPEAVMRVETLPRDAVLDWTVRVVAADRTWSASAPGAAIVSFTALGPGERALTPARNGLGDLAEAWVRGAGGVWSARGPWPAGLALPPPESRAPGESQAPDPPGWLASGLPQGVGVLVGRLAPGALAAGRTAADGPTWLRLVGFDSPDD
ncbi:MAG: hypothetical protein E2O39_14040 [Planctomycetota bacterium]|nr:MAG: hypothetical protein E2O39_14040 [Planctomycetota bacterium]